MAPSMQCAICYEEVSESIELPCACKVDYCFRCWDRALASSFNLGDHSSCPTCRTPIHVDFDADKCGLVFTKEADEATAENNQDIEVPEDTFQELERLHDEIRRLERRSQSPGLLSQLSGLLFGQAQGKSNTERAREQLIQRCRVLQAEIEGLNMRRAKRRAERHKEAVDRLLSQALPATIRILERYRATNNVDFESYLAKPQVNLNGMAISTLKEQIKLMGGTPIGYGVEKEDVVQKLIETAESSGVVASFLASQMLDAPSCVCGSSLDRIDSKERTLRFLRKRYSEENAERAFQSLVQRGQNPVICDLCDDHIPFQSFVWTCKNEDCTIFHATAYDICDKCFVQHACKPCLPPTA